MDNETKIVLLGGYAAVVAAVQKLRRERKCKRNRRMWVREIYLRRKEQGFCHNLVAEMRLSSPELFFNFARMTAVSLEHLLFLCGSLLKKHSPREAISPEDRLLVTLRFLATGDSYPSLGYAFRIAPSTICNIIQETCGALWQVLSPMVLALPLSNEWLQISQNFWRIWQLPNCVGSMDGKHVRIKAPSHSGSLYYNYKKYFSLVLFAICDAKYNFTYVNIGAYGSQSDGGVLRNSEFGQLLKNGMLNLPDGQELPNTNIKVPLYFVGDEAFSLQTDIMRPYSKQRNSRMPEDEVIFNYRLSRARRTIENSFGVMVARFRIYHRVINAKPETVDNIIKATTCLHNFIKRQQADNELYCNAAFVDHDLGDHVIPGQWRNEVNIENSALGQCLLRFGNRNYSRNAFDYRNFLKEYLNGIGSVSWQTEYVRRTE